ncbi:putative prolyl 4-hydroxylase 11 [Raphanus sativus]|uniref:Probable prolyl 4-hydroxylase 11 isoform X3 n=1 Tax=Raphanus sativus TaxID=3726 RepID=A0A6J0MF42_RAPSA|nr:probable prolyl 4-hydroxylase 11 isoform X3 [Raphanus sativus]KAJ4913976.1 putative prolyl 4-hydroxylase 11 [Raphanus sativus]
MSMSTSPSTASQYLKERLQKLKIYGVSDLMQHIDTFKETMGDTVNVKIDDLNNLSVLFCSLPPLLTALTCKIEKVDASLRFPHERWPEVISWKPRAFLYHNFLKNEECEHLISLAKPYMKRSRLRDPGNGGGDESSARTSTGTFIGRGHDKIVEEIENRISEFTFLPVENGEGLQVINYEVGQKFDPHYDGFGRLATFLMYLSDVDDGGETAFPMSSGRLSVSAKKGDAVLFWNKRPDGSQDPSSLHCGRPVIKGNKWASTKWFHPQEFKGSYKTQQYNPKGFIHKK